MSAAATPTAAAQNSHDGSANNRPVAITAAPRENTCPAHIDFLVISISGEMNSTLHNHSFVALAL
jgi:hypothetical protein